MILKQITALRRVSINTGIDNIVLPAGTTTTLRFQTEAQYKAIIRNSSSLKAANTQATLSTIQKNVELLEVSGNSNNATATTTNVILPDNDATDFEVPECEECGTKMILCSAENIENDETLFSCPSCDAEYVFKNGRRLLTDTAIDAAKKALAKAAPKKATKRVKKIDLDLDSED